MDSEPEEHAHKLWILLLVTHQQIRGWIEDLKEEAKAKQELEQKLERIRNLTKEFPEIIPQNIDDVDMLRNRWFERLKMETSES